ncbi:MAG TPA: TRAFs-binding domain-containing protein, partial [Thermoanaerobaculia bacterium]|nr:TRAFs-binding domain-containing protein [Thermoanaerobaculia bacterium]
MQSVCYVSTPFGQKYGVDFDRVFMDVIRPAVEAAGLACKRADDFAGGVLHKSVLSLVLGSEVMIADVTNTNPNVMYELGIRSVASRYGAILISARASTLPWNIDYMRVVEYDPTADEAGRERFRRKLTDVVREHVRVRQPGPVYQFFPDLEVRLPHELEREPEKPLWVRRPWRLRSPVAVTTVEARSPEQMKDMIADLPRSAKRNPEVARLYALALNRKGDVADRDRAIELLTKVLEEHGADPETLATLGRVLKDRYADSHAEEDREAAVAAFVAAYYVNPRDFYSG